jgi:hypothetical protein
MPVMPAHKLSIEGWSGGQFCLFSRAGDSLIDRLKYIENISVTGKLAVKQRIN